MSQWQPIATAPRDGTRILAFQSWETKSQPSWVDPDKHITVAWWNGDEWQDVKNYIVAEFRHSCGPLTHWMPLPEPPS